MARTKERAGVLAGKLAIEVIAESLGYSLRRHRNRTIWNWLPQ